MWPLSGLEIVKACGVRAWSPSVEPLRLAGVVVGETPPEADDLFIALREAGHDGHAYVAEYLELGAALALVSADWDGLPELAPEMRARCLVVDDSLAAFRDLAAALRRRFPFPVVAVGGSNGKTTTKDMIAALLSGPGFRVTSTRETMNGWTGLPLTLTLRAHALALPPHALVVEIGIDAPGAMAEHARLVDPDVAVLTALGPEHLAGLGTWETAIVEEMKLFDVPRRARRVFQAHDAGIRAHLTSARDGDILVCRAGDSAALARQDLSVLGYEVASPSPMSSEVELSYRPAGGSSEPWRGRFEVPMPGRHNGDNFAAALAVGLALGRTPRELAAGWATFSPPAMRCQASVQPNGCIVIDDSYNGSPASVRAAFELLSSPAWRERRRLVILGDMLDLGAASERYHLELCEPLRALVDAGAQVLLFGDAMRVVHQRLAERGVATSLLPPDADPRALLDVAPVELARAVVLVKGSRGMQLERVVAEFARRCTAGAGPEIAPPGAQLAELHGRFATACVTGTNGKTTTTSLIAAIVEAAGEPACRVTTLGAWVDGESTGAEATGDAFVRTIARAAERGVRTLAIETTSQALAQGFARSWPARVAVFTNLTRDHLDYHGTPEDYLAAKAQLFMALPPEGVAVLNVADPASALLDEVTPPGVRRLGYAARPPHPACAAIPIALFAGEIDVDAGGTRARLAPSPIAQGLGGRLELGLVGSVHVENALAAALAASALGYDFGAISAGLAKFGGVPGRFQIVHRRPLVVVDFAHTPDALARTLALARALVAAERGRVLCVFGCGGDRDPGKRGAMGAVAATAADLVVLTNDNPRGEDPSMIADAVAAGARGGSAQLERILDRAGAISRAVELAAPEDIVIVAGKGHEKTQIVGDREVPFDDVDVARNATMRRGDHR